MPQIPAPPIRPRDPGEALDGIGQYLYPSRPSVRV
jgi:hypothetical protein